MFSTPHWQQIPPGVHPVAAVHQSVLVPTPVPETNKKIINPSITHPVVVCEALANGYAHRAHCLSQNGVQPIQLLFLFRL